MKLGKKQLDLLKYVGTTSAVVVGDRTTRRLCELGLMKSDDKGDFAHITPSGLRALADAVVEGRATLFVMPTRKGKHAQSGGT